MLTLEIPGAELYDEVNNEFLTIKGQTIQLEHSLLSLSKWESKHHKHFIGNKNTSLEELKDYVRCMTITQNVDPKIYNYCLTNSVMKKILDYIDDPMTATTISNNTGQKSREIITSEIIYYWMISLNIPFECQKWHLNKLLMLIRVCEIKNSPSKKMSKKDIYASNRALNASRRAAIHSKG